MQKVLNARRGMLENLSHIAATAAMAARAVEPGKCGGKTDEDWLEWVDNAGKIAAELALRVLFYSTLDIITIGTGADVKTILRSRRADFVSYIAENGAALAAEAGLDIDAADARVHDAARIIDSEAALALKILELSEKNAPAEK